MKAIRFDRYGSPDVLELRDVEMPAVGDDELLVRVRAASVNPLDWHFMRGMPYAVRLLAGLTQPKASARKLGADMAGVVEAVGRNVSAFRPGDEVFGGLEERGCLGEYITIGEAGAVVAQAGQPDLRAGSCCAGGRMHGVASAARQGAPSAWAEGARQRRLWRSGHVRGPDS